jgi:hypothetical protein
MHGANMKTWNFYLYFKSPKHENVFKEFAWNCLFGFLQPPHLLIMLSELMTIIVWRFDTYLWIYGHGLAAQILTTSLHVHLSVAVFCVPHFPELKWPGSFFVVVFVVVVVLVKVVRNRGKRLQMGMKCKDGPCRAGSSNFMTSANRFCNYALQ